MFNFKLIIKKFNKILISTNELIESFFNRINKYTKNKKKNKSYLKNIDKKITIGISSIVIIIFSYFLIPTFYNKDEINSLIKNQILEKYNLKVKFNQNLKYGLFPKPHFFSDDLTINYLEEELAISKNTKIHISINNFFSPDKIKIKNIFFKKNEFSLNSNTMSFFIDVLNSNKSENKLFFKKSNFFYKNKIDDVVFLSKINQLNFEYDQENLVHKAFLKFQIFNLPFTLVITNNLNDKKTIMELKSKKIRLNIKNYFNYLNDIDGSLNVRVINKEKIFNYEVNDNNLKFLSKDLNFDGNLEFKPFYFTSNLNFNNLNLKNLFVDESIIINLINSKIFNNPNLNANLNINFNDVSNRNNLKNFIVKIFLKEGDLFIKNSSVTWNNSVLINFDDVQLITDKNIIKMIGTFNFKFKDLDNFYSYYQVKRNYRSKMDSISLDFVHDLSQQKITLDNLKIDNKSHKKINNFLNKFNSQNKNMFNKVTFRNFIKEFFSYYEG